MKRIVVVFISLIALSSGALAATPEEISKAYFEMMKKRQWTEIAKLYDAAALKDFKDMMSFIVESPDETSSEVLETFFGTGTTKQAVKAMSDLDFFSSFLRGIMDQAAKVGQLDFKKVEVLGSIPEGESLRHVVIRTHMAMGEMSMESMEVVSFKKKDDKWGILLQGKIKGMAQQIRSALQNKRR